MKKLLFSLVACFMLTAATVTSQSDLSERTLNSSDVTITEEITGTTPFGVSAKYGYWALINHGFALITVDTGKNVSADSNTVKTDSK